MEKYKKKTFNFQSNESSKFSRVTETLKTRESSRFKRLSFLRNLDNDVSDCKEEETKEIKPKERKETRKPPSRLEMLAKFKKEKLMKKEMEKKNAAKPFKVGGGNIINGNNFQVTSGKSLQTSRIQSNPKLMTSAASSQTSRILNNPKGKSTTSEPMQASRNQTNSKLVKSSTLMPLPTSKNHINSKMNFTSGTKVNYNPTNKSSKPSGISVPSTKNQMISTTSSLTSRIPNNAKLVKSGSSVQASRSQANSKMTITSGPKVNKDLMKKGSKPLGASTVSNKNQTGLTTFASPRGIPKIQSRMPAPSFGFNKKPLVGPVSKITPISAKSGEKGFGFKKTANNLSGNNKLAVSTNAELKKEKLETFKKLPSLEKSSSEIFDCDCSIIPSSFAPDNFQFAFNTEMLNFDEDALARIKAIVSRTSTPSKPSEKSPIEVSNDFNGSLCNNTSVSVKENFDQIVNQETDVEDCMIKCSSPPKPSNKLIKDILSDDIAEVEEEILNQSVNRKTGVKKELNLDLDEVLQKSVEEELSKNSDLANHANTTKNGENELTATSKCEHPKQSEEGDSRLPLDDSVLVKKFENEEELDIDEPENNADKGCKKKLSSSVSKRPSMLKNMSILNAIAETDETIAPSPIKSTEKVFTPRRSRRFSKLLSIDESPIVTTDTPRRSGRLLQKSIRKCQFEEESMKSPFTGQKSERKSTSMQLVDINIPDKGVTRRKQSSTNITVDFDKLTLEDFENMDPNDFLIDFGNTPENKMKSKKVSLLYSPEKRRSIRKSIRGDLMSFSPIN